MRSNGLSLRGFLNRFIKENTLPSTFPEVNERSIWLRSAQLDAHALRLEAVAQAANYFYTGDESSPGGKPSRP